MALFNYQAKDQTGKLKKGKITAKSQHEAYSTLRHQKLRVLNVEEIPETIWNKDLNITKNIKQRDFVIYLRQFATLIKAGITIVNATDLLAKQTDSKTLQKILVEIEADLRNGNNLSAAYTKHPQAFKPLFTHMIQAGETSGTIDVTLERLANYYDRQYRLRQKVISALMYPLILTLVSLIVVIFLLLFMVPLFIDLFENLEAELPLITQVVINLSNHVQNYWWLFLLMIGLIASLIIVVKKSEQGQYRIDQVLLKLPIFGTLFQKSVIARTTSTLSSLFASSVPVLQAVEIAEKVAGNKVIEDILHQGRDCLEQGESLTTPMKDHWAIPPLVMQMIMIGEQSGSLDTMLAEVAAFYEAEVETTTDRLKVLIEPVMILVLTAVIGTIVLAIMVPMFEVFNNI